MRRPLFLSLLLLTCRLTVAAIPGQELSLHAERLQITLGERTGLHSGYPLTLFAGAAPLLRDFHGTYAPAPGEFASAVPRGKHPDPCPAPLAWRALAQLPVADYLWGLGAADDFPAWRRDLPLRPSSWQRRLLMVRHAGERAPDYLLVRDDFVTLHPPVSARWRVLAAGLTLRGVQVHAVGNGDIDLLATIVQPDSAVCTSGNRGREQQLVIHAGNGGSRCYLTLFVPHPRGEAAPEVIPIADGSGVKITAPATVGQRPVYTEYAFVSPIPVTFTEGLVSFSGCAGFVRLEEHAQTIMLATGGLVTTPGVTIQAGGPVSLQLTGRDMHVRTNGAKQLIRLSGTFASWQVTSGGRPCPAMLRQGVLSLPVPPGPREFLLRGRIPATKQ
ncbi:MAG: hypothetical protein ACYC7E_19825 [Armatimonadota bacterium]